MLDARCWMPDDRNRCSVGPCRCRGWWKSLATLVFYLAANVSHSASSLASDRLDLVLPTANDALLRGEPAAFYQYVERHYHDETSYPWEGGQYGFVRDPVDAPDGGFLCTRFHEGVDIKPLRRDAHDEPLDDVLSVAPGTVVHVSPEARASNYGKYVVVEHRWNGCPYYALYAHLSEIFVTEDQPVVRGAVLARMGHTGDGIDRPRSHVHFELNLMLSTGFDAFYQAGAGPTEPNRHGLFHGQNLAGLDVGRLFLELRQNPALTIPEFLANEETFFRVLLPADPSGRPPDLLRLYPWMGAGPGATTTLGAGGTATPAVASWEVSFTRSGLPLKVLPAATAVTVPTLSYAKPADVPYWQLTHRLLFGAGKLATLSPYGRKLADLLMATAAPPPRPAPPASSPTPSSEPTTAEKIRNPAKPPADAARRRRP